METIALLKTYLEQGAFEEAVDLDQKQKNCVNHNGIITWNFSPDIFKVKVSFSMFKSKVRNFYLEKY